MYNRTRVIIADDHPIFRSGLRHAIEQETEFEVVGEASDGETALELIERERPDIVVLDINMPKLNGFAVLEEMRNRDLPGRAVILTMHNQEAVIARAMELGVRGYVVKESADEDIVNCLRAVSDGQSYTSPIVTDYLIKRAGRSDKPCDGIGSLTPTERTILKLIGEYKTSREIADEMFISVRTVENHRNNISSKLGVRGSLGLIKYVMNNPF